MEKTFAIIKPDAVEARNAGRILSRIEAEGFRVVALKGHRLTRAEAEGFYAEHRGKGIRAQVTALDTLLGRMNTTSTFLTQQLAKLDAQTK